MYLAILWFFFNAKVKKKAHVSSRLLVVRLGH